LFRSSAGRVFASIEELRKLCQELREHPNPQLLEASGRAVARLRVDEATAVAHAFSLFFHLVNLCEEQFRACRCGIQYAGLKAASTN
jgi:phosphoenolpyruvate carboxylase